MWKKKITVQCDILDNNNKLLKEATFLLRDLFFNKILLMKHLKKNKEL